MKAIKTLSLACLCASMLASCSPMLKVTSDYDRAVNFTTYKTFKFYNLKTTGSVSQLNADRIVNAIRTNLTSKGLKETSDSPDLMINAVTVLKNKQAVSATTDYYGYGGLYRPYGYWGGMGGVGYTDVSTYDYKDGSLVIDIVDTKTNKLVWEGTGNKEIDQPSSDVEAAVYSAVNKIMANYPPAPAK